MPKFTDRLIDAESPPEKGQRFLFDQHRDAPRGFGLRLTAAGGKAFVMKYTSPLTGKSRRLTIGDYPTWSLVAARERAKAIRRDIDTGSDPLGNRQQKKSAPTVAEAVTLYVESHVDGLASANAIKRYFERDLVPVIGTIKVADIRRRDIIEIVEAKAIDTPTAAKHLLVYTKGLFDWLVDREYIEHSPAVSIKPKSISPKGRKGALKSVQRLRILDDDEIRAFWNSAEHCGIHRLTALCLKLVLVTGQRPGEVAGMHRDEITHGMWTIPAARRLKTETENRVPLTALAMRLIDEAELEVERLQARRKGDPAGYVFEARPGRHVDVGSLSRAVKRYAVALSIKTQEPWGGWRPHDLRRTCRTGLSACGISGEIAERVIGHGGKGIEATYNQHTYDPEKLAALEAWERRLTAIIEGKQAGAGNVVPLARALA